MNYVKNFAWNQLKENLFDGWGEAANEAWGVARDTVTDQVKGWQETYWETPPGPEVEMEAYNPPDIPPEVPEPLPDGPDVISSASSTACTLARYFVRVSSGR